MYHGVQVRIENKGDVVVLDEDDARSLRDFLIRKFPLVVKPKK